MSQSVEAAIGRIVIQWGRIEHCYNLTVERYGLIKKERLPARHSFTKRIKIWRAYHLEVMAHNAEHCDKIERLYQDLIRARTTRDILVHSQVSVRQDAADCTVETEDANLLAAEFNRQIAAFPMSRRRMTKEELRDFIAIVKRAEPSFPLDELTTMADKTLLDCYWKLRELDAAESQHRLHLLDQMSRQPV